MEIRGSLLARNTLLNFIGQVLPLLVGVVTMPFTVRGLGTERFGLLSLAWVILGYFAVFDLGLGRATTKFVAEALGKGEQDRVPGLVWTTVATQALLGAAGGLTLAAVTPLLVERALNVPPYLVREASSAFYVLAVGVPVTLISGSFVGVLGAAQRFDLVNAVKIPASCLTYLLPLLGLALGLGLPAIVALILAARLAALIAFLVLNLRLIPGLKRWSAEFSLFRSLFSFGAWVTISSIVSPILVYLDRFLIGSVLSMSAVAYYSAPYEVVTRLLIIPGSLTTALFPAFSALEAVRDRGRASLFFARSIKYILLALGPVVLLIGLFAREGLQIWLGPDFASESTAALQILGVGVLINSLAQVPFALLQGVGRPDLPAKFHLLELPLYVGVAWLMICRWGIAGAAGAWTLRVTLDAALLFGAAFRGCQLPPSLLSTNGMPRALYAVISLGAAAYAVRKLFMVHPLLVQALMVLGLLVCFAWFCWWGILNPSERGLFIKGART